MELNPKTDLVLERSVEAPASLLWKAWTKAEHLKAWFTPKPWTTPVAELDVRPGGKFRTVMRGPDGEEFDNVGCYLEVIEEKKLVWTTALLPDWRPVDDAPPFHFTAVLTLEEESGITNYRIVLMHSDEDGAKKHEEMGFHDGWGTAFKQMIEHLRGVN